MRAHRNTDGVRTSFYVTGQRLGVDFGLLSADSRPLTERQLKGRSGAGRLAEDSDRVPGPGRLPAVRPRPGSVRPAARPAARTAPPDAGQGPRPGKVSDTLSAGLSPVDEDLVQQAARDFENLAAVQKLFEDLTAANAATADFLTHYGAYLRAHLKFQLDRVQARTDAASGHAREDHRGRRDLPAGGCGRAARGGGAQRPAGRGREAAGAPGRAEELRGVQGAGPDRGQAPRGDRPGTGGRGPARPARPGPPSARRSREGGRQAQPPCRRGRGRGSEVRCGTVRRRPAVRHRRRRLRPHR